MTGNGVPTEAELLTADLERNRGKHLPKGSRRLTQRELRAVELDRQPLREDPRGGSASEPPHPWAPRYPFLP